MTIVLLPLQALPADVIESLRHANDKHSPNAGTASVFGYDGRESILSPQVHRPKISGLPVTAQRVSYCQISYGSAGGCAQKGKGLQHADCFDGQLSHGMTLIITPGAGALES